MPQVCCWVRQIEELAALIQPTSTRDLDLKGKTLSKNHDHQPKHTSTPSDQDESHLAKDLQSHRHIV